ncbi:MAG: hypothetical protein JST05_03110 [Acidobacteria bacterium]|nr:hypothetical protein [Acidobacteriota bacterium]
MAYRDQAWSHARARALTRAERSWAKFDSGVVRRSKPRGNRRYYEWLRAWAQAYEFRALHEGDWFDGWHQHIGMGRANCGVSHHLEHLRALLTVFEHISEALESWPKPSQIWMFVDTSDGTNDAVFIQTPNPNRDNFPRDWGDIDWSARKLPPYMDVFDQARFEIGAGDGPYFIVRARGRIAA